MAGSIYNDEQFRFALARFLGDPVTTPSILTGENKNSDNFTTRLIEKYGSLFLQASAT